MLLLGSLLFRDGVLYSCKTVLPAFGVVKLNSTCTFCQFCCQPLDKDRVKATSCTFFGCCSRSHVQDLSILNTCAYFTVCCPSLCHGRPSCVTCLIYVNAIVIYRYFIFVKRNCIQLHNTALVQGKHTIVQGSNGAGNMSSKFP